MKKIKIVILCFAAMLSLLAVSCKRDEIQVIPSYLSIDAINVANTPNDSWSNLNGFFTNAIDAAEVIIYVDGDTAETVLGVFQLPAKIPVLRQGNIDRITISPVVKQNGIAATRIYYPYYKKITFNNVRLTPDSVTRLDTLTTYYQAKSSIKVPWQEFFSGGQTSILLDSVVDRITGSNDTICSDRGSGVVRVKEGQNNIHFWSTDSIDFGTDATKYVYLEMDYRSDFDFSIGFKNPTPTSGEVDYTYSLMTVTACKHWQKMYINLGRLWSQYSYYRYIRLYFTIFNDEGKAGNLYLDNMKVLIM